MLFRGGISILFVTLTSQLSWAQDKIVLKNGGVLEGNILTETKDSIEIRIAEGQVIGFPRKDANEILRGVSKPAAPSQPNSEAKPVLAIDEWYRAEDRNGKQVGTCHFLSRKETQLGREYDVLEMTWLFSEKEGDLRVTWIEQIESKTGNTKLIYREEGVGAGKVVLAQVEKDTLKFEISAGAQKRRSELPWNSECHFPLSWRLDLRKKAFEKSGSQEASVFDPAHSCFSAQKVSWGEKKIVPWDEKEAPIFVIREQSSNGINEQWVDAKEGTIRWEWNGPDLVLHRSTTQEIEQRAKGELASSQSKVLIDPQGLYRLTVLDSSWEVLPAIEAGTLHLKNVTGDSSLVIFPLAANENSESVLSSLPLVEKKLSQALERYARSGTPISRVVQGKKGFEYGFQFVDGVEVKSARMLVLQGKDKLIVLVYSFPLRDANSAPVDWERWVSRIEITS